MRIPRGSVMTKYFAASRRSPSRAANALVFASAMMLAPLALPTAASAQTLGYRLEPAGCFSDR